jgi:phosphoheptose isomerase
MVDLDLSSFVSDFIKETFSFLHDYHLLVCRSCGYAVQGSHLATHLSQKHRLSRKFSTAIVATLQQTFPSALWTDNDIARLQLPTAPRPAIPYLPTYTNGF